MLASAFPVLFPTSRLPAAAVFGQLCFAPETVQGTLPTSGNTNALRVVNSSFKPTIKTLKSAEIDPTRMARTSVNVDMDVIGGFDFELSAGAYDPFLESAICSSWLHYGDLGVSAPMDLTTATGTVTASSAPTGSSAFGGLTPGSWFKIRPPASASAGTKAYFARRWLKVSSTSSTQIVLDPTTQLSGLGLTSLTGCNVLQSTLVNGNQTKSFYFEWAQRDVRHYFQYGGMRVNTLALSFDTTSLVTGSFDFAGMSHQLTGSSVMPGAVVQPTQAEVMNTATGVVLSLESGVDLESTGSFVTGLKFNISNNLRGQKAVGVFGSAGVGVGELAVSGSVDVYLADATHYRKWLAGQRSTLTFGVSDSRGAGYLVELTNVRFRDSNLRLGGLSSDVVLSLPFDALYDANNSRGLRITKTPAGD